MIAFVVGYVLVSEGVLVLTGLFGLLLAPWLGGLERGSPPLPLPAVSGGVMFAEKFGISYQSIRLRAAAAISFAGLRGGCNGASIFDSISAIYPLSRSI